MQGLKRAIQKIKEAKSIVIASHINPDGDSIGSLLSLGLAFEKLGKRVYMVSPDGVPKRYRKLPGAMKILRRTDASPDLAIAVDCGSKEILGEAFRTFKKAKDIIEIDHHEFRRPFGNIALLDYKAAAVGELVYLLLKRLGVVITKAVAENILASLIVETNSFRLPRTRAVTFDICADLIKKGVDFYKLTEMVYWSKPKEAAILSGICLERSKFLAGERIVWSIVRMKDLARVKGLDEDADAIADEMRAIKNVQIAVLFREANRRVLRVSLRAKGSINVTALVDDCGGGGHFDAAGCFIPNTAKAMSELLKKAQKLISSSAIKYA